MTTPEPFLPPSNDVLGSPQPVARGSSASRAVVALVGAGALTVAGSAVAFAAYLSGGGAQPEDVIPASALAMVKLDLDPAAGQKVAVYRLAERFPSVADDVQDQDRVKDDLLSALFEDVEELDYETDVQPWIGDRVGAALMPGGEEPQPLAAVAYTDRGAADEAMQQLRESDDELFYAFSEKADYVLLGTSQEAVDSAARTEEVLADDASWGEGVDALDGDQIVTAWADLGAVWESLPAEAREQAAEVYGVEADFALAGTVVAGVHAADDHVEVVGKAIDVESPLQLESAVGGGEGSGLVQGLPADTVAALSVTNLGAGLAELFDTAYGSDDPMGLVAAAEEIGVRLPEDLQTLLGDETLLAAFGESDLALRSRTEDVDGAMEVAESLGGLLSPGSDPSEVLRRLDDGIALGSSADAVEAISETDGGLGDTDAFRTAVPDAEDAGYLVYVDLARALELFGGELGQESQDAAALQSFGMSGSGDSRNSTFRLRLTVRD